MRLPGGCAATPYGLILIAVGIPQLRRTHRPDRSHAYLAKSPPALLPRGRSLFARLDHVSAAERTALTSNRSLPRAAIGTTTQNL